MVKEVESTPELIEQQVNITNIVSFVVRYRVAEPHFQINDVIIWRKYRFVINNIKADWKRSYLTLTATSEMETSDRNGGV